MRHCRPTERRSRVSESLCWSWAAPTRTRQSTTAASTWAPCSACGGRWPRTGATRQRRSPGCKGDPSTSRAAKCSAVRAPINAMIYIRGNRRDFDTWSRLGNDGWAYDDVLPYFKKSETYHGLRVGLSRRQRADLGHRLPASVASRPRLRRGRRHAGRRQTYNDFNGASQEAGAGFYQSTRTPDGVRVSAASAFIRPSASAARTCRS